RVWVHERRDGTAREGKVAMKLHCLDGVSDKPKGPHYIAVVCVVLATGCQTQPISPTITEPPSVPSVPTETVNAWDTASELRAWVNNGVSTGAATVVGDGPDAVIRL